MQCSLTNAALFSIVCFFFFFKKISLEADRQPTEEKIFQLESNITSLRNELDKEMSLHMEEVKRLKENIEEQNKEISSLSSRLEEQQAENQSLKYKYSSTIRVSKHFSNSNIFHGSEFEFC